MQRHSPLSVGTGDTQGTLRIPEDRSLSPARAGWAPSVLPPCTYPVQAAGRSLDTAQHVLRSAEGQRPSSTFGVTVGKSSRDSVPHTAAAPAGTQPQEKR